MTRLVPDGLAMRGDGCNLRSRNSRLGDCSDGGAGQPFSEIETESTVFRRRSPDESARETVVLLSSVGSIRETNELGVNSAVAIGESHDS